MGQLLVRVVRQLPSEPGVYRFRDSEGEALYVGPAAQLRSRVASYWSDQRDRRHLQQMVAAWPRSRLSCAASDMRRRG